MRAIVQGLLLLLWLEALSAVGGSGNLMVEIDIVRSCGELPLKEVIKLVSIIRKKHKIQNNLLHSNKLNQKSTGV